jgi:hypothetical protein
MKWIYIACQLWFTYKLEVELTSFADTRKFEYAC